MNHPIKNTLKKSRKTKLDINKFSLLFENLEDFLSPTEFAAFKKFHLKQTDEAYEAFKEFDDAFNDDSVPQ